MMEKTPSLSDVRFSAIGMLALREHSAKELRNKLERKFANHELIESVITGLMEQQLQSDERFAQAFVSMRQRQGKGPLIIKFELREKGISSDLIDQLVDDSDGRWSELACNVRDRKFRGTIPSNRTDRAKQMRFLQARGFSSRHIQAALSAKASEI